jgi:hypothetical protein
MGLSRRLFTKEFKPAAVRRLEQGVSIGEAAFRSGPASRKHLPAGVRSSVAETPFARLDAGMVFNTYVVLRALRRHGARCWTF